MIRVPIFFPLSSNVTGSVQGGVQHKELLVASIPLGKLSR